jgi:haloalkane dehalogenase
MGTAGLNRKSLESLYPFRSRYLRFDDLRYHYLDEGRGEPVLMLHGNPTWSFYYRELVGSLSDRYRVIVPDHMGCGLSDKPAAQRYPYRLQNRVDDLERLLSHLDLADKLTLVLHDWGGMIGISYALRHPDRIARLVVLNTAAFMPPAGKRLPWRLKLIRNGKLLSALLVQGLNAFALAAAHMASHKGLSAPVRRGLLAPYDCWSHRIAMLKFVEDIPLSPGDPSYDLVDYADNHLHRLSQLPTLICWGLRDFVFDRDYLAEWQRRFEEAEIHSFDDAGHYVLEDVPERIIPLVRRFLERHPLE